MTFDEARIALTEPLVFGDERQIAAARLIQRIKPLFDQAYLCHAANGMPIQTTDIPRSCDCVTGLDDDTFRAVRRAWELANDRQLHGMPYPFIKPPKEKHS